MLVAHYPRDLQVNPPNGDTTDLDPPSLLGFTEALQHLREAGDGNDKDAIDLANTLTAGFQPETRKMQHTVAQILTEAEQREDPAGKSEGVPRAPRLRQVVSTAGSSCSSQCALLQQRSATERDPAHDHDRQATGNQPLPSGSLALPDDAQQRESVWPSTDLVPR